MAGTRTVVEGQIVEQGRAEETWRSKDGREIPISEMLDEHLLNALNKILREGKFHAKKDALLDEAVRRRLCLNTKPSVSRLQKLASALRRPARSP